MIQKILFILLMLMIGVAQATAFKCKTSGGIVYSENPCPKDSTIGIIQTNTPSEEEVATAKNSVAKNSRQANISIIESEIRGYKQDRDREIAALKAKELTIVSSMPNSIVLNSNVNQYNSDLSQKIDAITQSYKAKIDDANLRLEQTPSEPKK